MYAISDLSIVVGAGASFHRGIPGDADFRDKAEEYATDPTEERLLQLWRRHYDGMGLEEFANALVFHKEIDQHLTHSEPAEESDLPIGPVQTDDINLSTGAILRALKQLVERTISESTENAGFDAYSELARQILEAVEFGSDVYIVSLNWDGLLEAALEEQTGRPLRIVGINDFEGPGSLRVIKPHGAVYIRRCTNCDQDRELWQAESYQPHPREPCPSCGEMSEPWIVPPLHSKELREEDLAAEQETEEKTTATPATWYDAVWKATAQTLGGQGLVCSFGYSWPEADHLVRIQTKYGLGPGPTNNGAFMVVGPAEEPERRKQRYLDVLEDLDIRPEDGAVFAERFRDFVRRNRLVELVKSVGGWYGRAPPERDQENARIAEWAEEARRS